MKIKKIKNISDNSNNYTKIGYYMVNFGLISEEDEVEKFYNSEYYYNYKHYSE